MAEEAIGSVKTSIGLLSEFDEKKIEGLRKSESRVDTYEDKIGSYLVKLSTQSNRSTELKPQ